MKNATARKSTRKSANRTLAAALRSHGLTPNGQVWADAKALVAKGLEPKAAARLVRSTLPAEEQDAAIARTKGTKVVEVTKAPVAQAPTTPEQPARRLSSRALDVKAGKVARDAKGRLLPA